MEIFNLISLKRNKGLILVIFFAFIFQGCAAPLIMPAYALFSTASIAMGGFSIYKSVQMTTGGKAEVQFEKRDLSLQDKEALSLIKSIAIYPGVGGQEKVGLAELLTQNTHYQIITPYAVAEALPKGKAPINFDQLTKREKIEHAYKICETLKVDGLFVFSYGGVESDIKFWSFSRSEVSTVFRLQLFSLKHKRVIWDQKGKLVVKGSSKFPSSKETEKILISALTEKFLEDTGKS